MNVQLTNTVLLIGIANNYMVDKFPSLHGCIWDKANRRSILEGREALVVVMLVAIENFSIKLACYFRQWTPTNPFAGGQTLILDKTTRLLCNSWSWVSHPAKQVWARSQFITLILTWSTELRILLVWSSLTLLCEHKATCFPWPSSLRNYIGKILTNQVKLA